MPPVAQGRNGVLRQISGRVAEGAGKTPFRRSLPAPSRSRFSGRIYAVSDDDVWLQDVLADRCAALSHRDRKNGRFLMAGLPGRADMIVFPLKAFGEAGRLRGDGRGRPMAGQSVPRKSGSIFPVRKRDKDLAPFGDSVKPQTARAPAETPIPPRLPQGAHAPLVDRHSVP